MSRTKNRACARGDFPRLKISSETRAAFNELLTEAPKLGLDSDRVEAAGLPGLRALLALKQAAGEAGIPLNRLRVGSGRNAVNPHTGLPEFFDPKHEVPMEEIIVSAPREDGTDTSAFAVDEYGRSSEDISNPDFRRGQGEAVINALPGMGVGRAMGYAPRWREGDGFVPTGGIENGPNVLDMMRSGNYGDAALTALGAVGDLGNAGIGGSAVKSFGQVRNYNRGMRAAEEVLANRADVMGAMKAPGSGTVDFRWDGGRSGGLEKVLRYHGEQSVRDVPEVLVYGQRESTVTDRGRPRMQYKLGDKEVALAPDYFGEPGNWVVTSFDRSKGKAPR